MDKDRNLDPQHGDIRGILRVVGPVAALSGAILTAIGLISFFRTLANPELGMPSYFWCAFIGLPLLAVGMIIIKVAFLGRISRYISAETAPVVRDTFNYLAEGTQPGVRTMATAVSEGLAAGIRRTEARCPDCAALNPPDASFCSGCGKALTITCRGCGRGNDPQAKFCSQCGSVISA